MVLGDKNLWDVIVIGTGMGGAVAGYELAKAGKKVLFVERGAGANKLKFGEKTVSDDPIDRLRGGLWPNKFSTNIDNVNFEAFPFIGCGVGGSTNLYASQLERFLPVDFESGAFCPNSLGADTPTKWPISYYEIEPYYRLAESLFKVRGGKDPNNLDPASSYFKPPEMSPRDKELYEYLKSRGLNPYRSHVACDFLPDCTECGGLICPKECKNDSRKICIGPAVNQYGASLVTDCEVISLESNEREILYINCKHRNELHRLRAKKYILAAGALASPIILLRSSNEYWKSGLGNRSGLVGKNLMFHASDYFLCWSVRGGNPGGAIKKSFSLNDFYTKDDKKLGTIQAVGVSVNSKNIQTFLQNNVSRMPRVIRLFVPLPLIIILANLASMIFRRSSLFASIVEDFPYRGNKVYINSKGETAIQYFRSKDLQDRTRLISSELRKYNSKSGFFVKIPQRKNLNYGHPCGTLRFGLNPATSVLDKNNKLHDLANIYVTDASFFPTSGGVNPSLTIAANALRVAQHISSIFDDE